MRRNGERAGTVARSPVTGFDGVFVMTKWMKTGIAGLAVAGTLAVTAAPAEAQRYRYRHRDNDRAALAIGAGIIGLGLAASLSNRDRYYDRGYYRSGYYGYGYDPYYDYGYYRPRYRRSYYRNRCRSRLVFDPYYGDYVRVRYC
jgi:hypothetical protein